MDKGVIIVPVVKFAYKTGNIRNGRLRVSALGLALGLKRRQTLQPGRDLFPNVGQGLVVGFLGRASLGLKTMAEQHQGIEFAFCHLFGMALQVVGQPDTG